MLVRETHKCGWIRTASTRRTVRRVKKPLRGFFRCAARDIHPRPPRTPVSEPGTGVSVLSAVQKERKGGFEQQQRRPLPAAETGRSCWGCGQQDARAAQGTMQPLGAATRAPFLRGSRHPPAPAKNSNIRTGYWCFCFICYAKGMQGEIRAISIYTLPHRYCICPRPVIPYK